MEGIEFGHEVIMIAVTISHSLECTDLIVDAFESASRDGEVVPVEDPGSVSLKRLKGVRNRLLTSERELDNISTWEDQNDQLRVVGFIMC